VDVEPAFPAHGLVGGLVEQGEGLFDDVAQPARALDSGGLGLGDERFGAAFPAGTAERRAAVGLFGQ